MDGIGADKAQHRDAGDKDSVGQAGDLRKAAAAEHADEQHEELHENKAREERVGHRRVLGEELGARGEALNDKTAHQNRRDGFAGDAKRQHRDQRAAGNGVVGRFRAADAFDGAVAEVLLVLGELLGVIVAHEAGDGRARARENADDVADDPGTDDRRREHLLLRFGKTDLIGELGGLLTLLDLLLGKDEHLRHGEETDERARRVDALGEERMAEHEALGAVDGVKADRGKEQAERAGHEALDDGLARNAGDDRKAEDTEPELFRRHEFQRELGKQRGEEVQGDAAEQAAPEGAPAGRGERLARLTLQRHLVAADAGVPGVWMRMAEMEPPKMAPQ